MMTHLVIMLGALVTTAGCVQPRVAEKPICRPFVSVTFSYCSRSLDRAPPVSPVSGCVEGCGCNGTGEERSGDGLAVVACRCPESCECKQAKEPVSPEPPAKKDPPLVPVSPAPTPQAKTKTTSRMECIGGQCYIVEPDGTRYRVIRRR